MGVPPAPTRLGFLYPGYAAEDDYPYMAARVHPPVEATVIHTSVGEDAHRVDVLLDLGRPERLAEGAEQLRGHVDAVMWACTSGSFVFGLDGAARQAQAVSDRLGVPASSTSFAFVDAATEIGAGRVAVAATYPPEVVAAFVAFLGEAGIDVVASGAQDIVTATEVGTLGHDRVVSFVASGDHPAADAVLVPDTALHTAAWIEDLEGRLGKPVLTANLVTLWKALELAGAPRSAAGLGRLFARA